MADNSISPSQCFEIGVTGTSIFSVLTVLSFYGFIKSHNRYSYLLFLALIFFCLLELPRYISLLVLRSYTDKICYSLHLVANSFYYLSISLVCYFIQAAVYQSKTTTTVAGAKEREEYLKRLVFERRVYISLNVLLAIVLIVTAVFCILSPSLERFFQHIVFKLYSILCLLLSVWYAVSFFYFTFRLRSLIAYTYFSSIAINKFKFAVTRLLLVSVICIGCILVRLAMLILKCEDWPAHKLVNITINGLLWFTFSDFIPKGVPPFIFFVFFGLTGRPRARRSSLFDKRGSACSSEYYYAESSELDCDTDADFDIINTDIIQRENLPECLSEPLCNELGEFENRTRIDSNILEHWDLRLMSGDKGEDSGSNSNSDQGQEEGVFGDSGTRYKRERCLSESVDSMSAYQERGRDRDCSMDSDQTTLVYKLTMTSQEQQQQLILDAMSQQRLLSGASHGTTSSTTTTTTTTTEYYGHGHGMRHDVGGDGNGGDDGDTKVDSSDILSSSASHSLSHDMRHYRPFTSPAIVPYASTHTQASVSEGDSDATMSLLATF